MPKEHQIECPERWTQNLIPSALVSQLQLGILTPIEDLIVITRFLVKGIKIMLGHAICHLI